MIDKLQRAAGSAAADCPAEGESRWMNMYRSALLGVLSVMVVLVGWEAERVIGRLDNIEKAQSEAAKTQAVTDNRILVLEKDKDAQWVVLNDHEHRITVGETSKLRGR